MKIPALKEISAVNFKEGMVLYGWFDAACKIYHVMPAPALITDLYWNRLDVHMNETYFFGAESRLLVEDK